MPDDFCACPMCLRGIREVIAVTYTRYPRWMTSHTLKTRSCMLWIEADPWFAIVDAMAQRGLLIVMYDATPERLATYLHHALIFL